MQRDDETSAVQLHAVLNNNNIEIIIFANNFTMPYTAWMDVTWKRLLPTNTYGKQREEIAVGQGKHG